MTPMGTAYSRIHDDPKRTFSERTYWLSSIQLALLAVVALLSVIIFCLVIWNIAETIDSTGNATAPPPPTYDYIIIGTGSTASVLARRISDAHPEVSILMLESGKYRNNDPAVWNALDFIIPYTNPMYTRNVLSVPDPNLANQQVPVQTGNMLGGTGNHDFMQYGQLRVSPL